MSDKEEGDRNNIVSYVGDSLVHAEPIVRIVAIALSLIRTVEEKYRKRQKQHEFDAKNIRELRHETGALEVLATEMRRHARHERYEIQEFNELYGHVQTLGHVSRRIGLKAKDPPFELIRPGKIDLENARNEPAFLLLEALFNELSRHSRKFGSSLLGD